MQGGGCEAPSFYRVISDFRLLLGFIPKFLCWRFSGILSQLPASNPTPVKDFFIYEVILILSFCSNASRDCHPIGQGAEYQSDEL
jgi:hypothetical protein